MLLQLKGVQLILMMEMLRNNSDEEPFAALAFKIMNDPFVGSLTFARIYSGVLGNRLKRLSKFCKGKSESGLVVCWKCMQILVKMLKKHAPAILLHWLVMKSTTTGDTLLRPI